MYTPRTWALLSALLLIAPGVADEPRLDRYGDPLPSGALVRLGTVRFRHGHSGPGSASAEFLPDGKTIVTGTSDGKLRFWDAATGKLLQTETALENGIRTMTLAPDGKRLAVAGFEGEKSNLGCSGFPLSVSRDDYSSRLLPFSRSPKLRKPWKNRQAQVIETPAKQGAVQKPRVAKSSAEVSAL